MPKGLYSLELLLSEKIRRLKRFILRTCFHIDSYEIFSLMEYFWKVRENCTDEKDVLRYELKFIQTEYLLDNIERDYYYANY